MSGGFTAKQAQFVAEYLIDLNATQAAIRAGYSAKTAGAVGHENLNKPEIASAVKTGMDARAQRTEITADRVMRELAKLGFSDIRKAVKWGSRFVERPEDDAPDGETLEDQPHGGALKRRRKGDDETDAFYITSIELMDSSELDDDTAAAVSEIAQTKEGVRIKFHDKKGALVDMGRHLGMFTDKIEHGGAVTVEVVRFGSHPPSGK